MKIAVIKTGGKQYLVKEKDKVKVEKLAIEPGKKATFDTLLVADGDKVEIGAPVVKGSVEGVVVRNGRGKKVTGVKYKPKTRQAKGFGHRQHYSEVEISKI
jgi:large subunit ribosomal protein L21